MTRDYLFYWMVLILILFTALYSKTVAGPSGWETFTERLERR